MGKVIFESSAAARRGAVGGVLALLLLAGCGPDTGQQGGASDDGQGEAPVLHVYNWSDYIAPEILAEFERETGISVVYDLFDSNELLETKLLAGGNGYDIVVPTATFLSRQIAAGVFQPLQRDQLPNWSNQWPTIMQRTAQYDPGNQYAINYMWGTTGIGYNVDEVLARVPDAPVHSWELVFNPDFAAQFADCGIYLLDTPEELVPAALNYLHEAPGSQDPAVLQKAEELLLAVRPYVRRFDSSEYINALANGDICIAIGWSGDVLQARARAREADNGVNIAYSIPREGAQMWFDMMAIPAAAPHPDNAHEFIDFLLRPEVIARISNTIYFANGNLAAHQFLNEDVIGDPAIYPSDEVIANLYTVNIYSPAVQREVNRMWTRIKSARPAN